MPTLSLAKNVAIATDYAVTTGWTILDTDLQNSGLSRGRILGSWTHGLTATKLSLMLEGSWDKGETWHPIAMLRAESAKETPVIPHVMTITKADYTDLIVGGVLPFSLGPIEMADVPFLRVRVKASHTGSTLTLKASGLDRGF